MSLDQVASPETSNVDRGFTMENKELPRLAAAVVALVIIAVTVLAALGRDTGQLLSIVGVVVLPLLVGLGYGKLKGIEEKAEQVRQNTNGSTAELLKQNAAINEKLIELLTRSQPIPEAVPNGESALMEKTTEIKYVAYAI